MPRAVASCRQFTQQGRSALERGEWDRAESLFNRAVDSCPSDTEARRRYAETLWHRGAGQQALDQMLQALKADPSDPLLAVRAGEMYLALGRVPLARQSSEQALAIDSRCAPAWALRGRSSQAAGDLRSALADYHRSLGYAPDNAQVLLELAEAYRQLGQADRALASLESLLDTYAPGEETQQVFYLKGLALAELGRNLEAADAYQMALARGRPTPELLFRLAQVELTAGRQGLASTAARQALAIDPAHQPSRALLAELEVAQHPPAGGVRR